MRSHRPNAKLATACFTSSTTDYDRVAGPAIAIGAASTATGNKQCDIAWSDREGATTATTAFPTASAQSLTA